MGDVPWHRLACENDPIALGIKDEKTEKWDTDKLIRHIDECGKCKEWFTDYFIRGKMP